MNRNMIPEVDPLPKRLRNEHDPTTGDIYLYTEYTDSQCIVRLESKAGEMKWKASRYSFIDHDFTESHYDIHESDLKSSYRLLLHPLEEILDKAESVYSGEAPQEESDADSTELMRIGHDKLLAMHDRAEMQADSYECVRIVLRAKINSLKEQMNARMRVLEKTVRGIQRKADTIRKVMTWLKAYMGEGVDAKEICSGKSAPKDEPLSIRQRILYMDEEVAIIGSDGQGLDWEGKETFYEWIKNPANRDIILPEQRCAVVMKPKRFAHRYSSDPVADRLMNEHNKHSFIMIRDGENIHAIESDDLEIYGTAIPTREQYEKINSDTFFSIDSEKKSDALMDLNNRAMYYMMLLQGLADNTDIFGCHLPMNISKEQNVRIIRDAEKGTMLGTGIKPFREWLAERQKNIRRGDRIIFRAEYRNDGEFLRIYFNRHSEPQRPKSGLYSVDESDSGAMIFRYLPGDKVFNQSEGWYTERRNRVAYKFYRSNVINFDTTSLEDLEAYLKDRTQREEYVAILGLLLKMREIKREEDALENNFADLLEADILKHLPGTDKENLRKTIRNAIRWWKNKVIFKRPLMQDDAKAWRMIKQKTLSEIDKRKKKKKNEKDTVPR